MFSFYAHRYSYGSDCFSLDFCGDYHHSGECQWYLRFNGEGVKINATQNSSLIEDGLFEVSKMKVLEEM